MIRRIALLALLLTALTPLFATPAAAAPQHVMIQDYAYGTAAVTVKVGESVSWTNHDKAGHDVVTTAGPASFRSPLLATGQTWAFKFTKPGTYSYYCSLHPEMKAQVVVLPADPPATSAAPAPRTTTSAAAKPRATTPPPAQAVAPAAPPVTTTTEPPVATAEPVVTQQSLDPKLLAAGGVTAIATLCLLLLSARRPE